MVRLVRRREDPTSRSAIRLGENEPLLNKGATRAFDAEPAIGETNGASLGLPREDTRKRPDDEAPPRVEPHDEPHDG